MQLDQRLPAGNRQSPIHGPQRRGISLKRGFGTLERDAGSVLEVPCVRVVAIEASQQASAHEDRHADARAVDGRPGLIGVDPSEVAPGIVEGIGLRSVRGPRLLQSVPAMCPGLIGHDVKPHSPWKVRLMTSICCSRVRRTKLTA